MTPETSVSPQDSQDDIADPSVPGPLAMALAFTSTETPAGVVQTLDALQAVQLMGQTAQKHFDDLTEQGKAVLRTVDSTWQVISRLCETVRTESGPALPHLVALLESLQEHGITLYHRPMPYTVTVQAVSPQGYHVSIQLHKAQTSEVIDELTRVLDWLHSQKYTPCDLSNMG